VYRRPPAKSFAVEYFQLKNAELQPFLKSKTCGTNYPTQFSNRNSFVLLMFQGLACISLPCSRAPAPPHRRFFHPIAKVLKVGGSISPATENAGEAEKADARLSPDPSW